VNALLRADWIVSHISQESVSHILVFWLRCSFLIVFRLDLKCDFLLTVEGGCPKWLFPGKSCTSPQSLTTYSSFGSGALFYCFWIRSQVANDLQFIRDAPLTWIKVE